MTEMRISTFKKSGKDNWIANTNILGRTGQMLHRWKVNISYNFRRLFPSTPQFVKFQITYFIRRLKMFSFSHPSFIQYFILDNFQDIYINFHRILWVQFVSKSIKFFFWADVQRNEPKPINWIHWMMENVFLNLATIKIYAPKCFIVNYLLKKKERNYYQLCLKRERPDTVK